MKRGGAFGGSKATGLVKGAVEAKAAPASEGKDTPRSETDDASDAHLGDAHKLWNAYTKLKEGAAAGPKVVGRGPPAAAGKMYIKKSELKGMLCELQRARRIMFVSMGQLTDFLDVEFAKFDKDGNAKMDFNEFYAFYHKWLNCDADAVLRRLNGTRDEIERCFLEADLNGDMTLDREEVCLS